MEFQDVKAKLQEATKRFEKEIVTLGHDFYATPETGFKEHKTMARSLRELEAMGLSITTYPGTTGFTSIIDTGRPGPTVCIMGELDSVVCFEHPDCNPETGAVHACGHHVQLTSVFGAAYALINSGVMEALSGKIMLMGVPAEECLEMEWRTEQIKKGDLTFLAGKPEFLERGVFDDVDAVIGMHTAESPEVTVRFGDSMNGFLAKTVYFKGKSAHAAGQPENGVNALYAANVGLMAFNAMRETFKDGESVRVHPIITKGGDIVNAIPEDVRVEVLVRAKTMDGVLDAAGKFDRAMGAGAYALGATAEIHSQAGYLPYAVYPELRDVSYDVALDLLGDPDRVFIGGHVTASSDVGDLCAVLPVIQPSISLVSGGHHTKDFRVLSDELYTFSSLYLATLAAKLLYGDGSLAKGLRENYKPMFPSPKAYCDYAKGLFTTTVLPE